MTIKIQLGPELYDHIRTLVHDELNEQKNRQKIEQLAMKIRAQLDQLSGPKTVHNWSKSRFGAVLND
jgi:ribosomal protein L29